MTETVEIFSLKKIKTLSPIDAKKYIDEFFYPLSNGLHAFKKFDNNTKSYTFEIVEQSTLKSVYFNRMPMELSKYYFKEKEDIKTINYNINKDTFYEDYINLCPKVKQTYKKYDTIDKKIQKKVNLMLKHIKEVLCNDKDDIYNFLMKWLANMIKGNRNDSALYLKGPQGAGKSTPLEFIREFVIGYPLAFQGGSGPIKNKFNAELSGKLMVMFEELENFSVRDWMGISVVLKRQITSKTLMIERKGLSVIEETNLNNYILLSNNDAIQDDDGRRYFILDISAKYINKEEYFNKLYNECFNDEVGQAFYSYCMEIDLTGYNAQKYPLTQSKLDSYSKRLDEVYKFLKEEYILKCRGIDKIEVSELYNKYSEFCGLKKPKGKIEFNKTLDNIQIKYFKSGSKNYYQISKEELKAISDKFKWVHALDEYNEEPEINPFDYGIEEPEYKFGKRKNIINELEDQIILLKQQLAQYQTKTEEPKQEEKIPDKELEEIEKEILKPKKPIFRKKPVINKVEENIKVEEIKNIKDIDNVFDKFI